MDSLRFDSDLLSSVSHNLERFTPEHLDCNNLRRAAVTVVLVDFQGESHLKGFKDVPGNSAAIILTRRKSNLNSHAGQWALPGGRIEAGESVIEAALRELEEEVNLVAGESQVIGVLDDFVTRSGYHITPVLLWGGDNIRLQANVGEVASIHRIPCSELMRRDGPILQPGVESERPILYMPVGDTCIASPTAAILYQFREVALQGKSTRVAHFDQPSFAWK